jgi:HSP20 family protein
MRKMQEEMDRLFSEFFNFESPFLALPAKGAFSNQLARTAEPSAHLFKAPVDLYETDKEVIAKFDIPGVDKKDIDIRVAEDRLSVKVEKKSQKEEKSKDYYFLERSYAGFYRSVPLPPYIKSDQAKAEYKDGVLTIKIPKDEEKLKSKEVKVNVE